ncbi:PH domain-containing protein [Rossellomorea sp. NS-SX7]|uniref:PH domain-containing protein n=1 Tax=Rossellomorea sp. NS-SX7 TaxID=3463856 RepID=UPI004059F223
MGVYQKLCYKVEDFFVKTLTKKQDQTMIKEKVASYRTKNEDRHLQLKEEKKKNAEEQQRIRILQQQDRERVRREKEAEEKREIENLISQVMDTRNSSYTTYEYNEIKKNRAFFQSLLTNVFEPNEKALTFIHCEYDKTKKQEIKGYLIPTNKRILFLNKNLTFMDKFRYQTVINVNWFKDGLLEKGLKIQYGKRRLEFDEIFDQEQMQRVGDIILNKSNKRVINS